jgi:hypothetical protein
MYQALKRKTGRANTRSPAKGLTLARLEGMPPCRIAKLRGQRSPGDLSNSHHADCRGIVKTSFPPAELSSSFVISDKSLAGG